METRPCNSSTPSTFLKASSPPLMIKSIFQTFFFLEKSFICSSMKPCHEAPFNCIGFTDIPVLVRKGDSGFNPVL